MPFARRETPPELTEPRLRGLWLSLNSPVVSVKGLPLRPARAAIAVHEEADGRPNVTVGVRSLEDSARVLFGYEGDLREASSAAVAVDAALSFAESMGFLFDEDSLAEPGPAARARALRQWRELTGESEWTAAPTSALLAGEDAATLETVFEGPAGAESGTSEPVELELTEPLDATQPVAVPRRTAAPAAAASFQGPSLTKFRTGLGAAAPGPPAEPTGAPAAGAREAVGGAPSVREGVAAGLRRAALGRLKLVRRRAGSPDRPGWISKLLSTF